MQLVYNLAYDSQASFCRKVKKNATDHLSVESPSHLLAGTETPALREFPPGFGRRHRPQPRRSSPMGVAGSGRTAPGSHSPAGNRQTPITPKVTSALNYNRRFCGFWAKSQGYSHTRTKIPLGKFVWDKLYLRAIPLSAVNTLGSKLNIFTFQD